MTNAHGGYLSSRCSNSTDSNQTFIPCVTAYDCPASETCTATSSGVDSLLESNGTILLVRWGTGSMAPGTNKRPYVAYTSNVGAFAGVSGATKNFFYHGLTIRGHDKAGIDVESGSDNVTATDLYIIYLRCGHGLCDGGSRGFAIDD